MTSQNELSLRLADLKDAEFLYELRMRPEVREASINPEVFSIESHQAWFQQQIAQGQSKVFIIMLAQVPVGQVRVDSDGGVSIALVVEARGKGLGKTILERTLFLCKKEGKMRALRAWVREDNLPSQKIFKAVGFSYTGQRFESGGRSFIELSFTLIE